MSGTTSTVSVSDLAVSLEAATSTEHDLVLAAPQGTLRVRGSIEDLRRAAQRGLGMAIPPLPRPTAAPAASAPASDTDARLARVEEALVNLTAIADAARRRGLI